MNRVAQNLNDLPDAFDALNALHPLRPIADGVDLSNAREIADALAVLKARTKDQEDYLETLSTLIEKYEAEQEAFGDDDDLNVIEVLRALMAGHDMSASDLGRVLGNRELGAAILRGDRHISKANMIKLAAHFSVSPAVFMRP